MDRTDRQIIGHLQEEGTLTNAALARNIGVSEETVRRRLKRLTQEGLLRIVAIPNDEMMGLGTKALLGVKTDPGLVDAAAEIMAENSAIQWIVVTTGQFDLVAQVAVTDTVTLYEVMQHLGKIVAVDSIEAMVVLDSPKLPHMAAA